MRCHAMLCYAMHGYQTIRSPLSGEPVPLFAVLCYATLCYAMLHFITGSHLVGISLYATVFFAIPLRSYHGFSIYWGTCPLPCWAMQCFASLCYALLPDATGSPLRGEPCLPCCAMLGCAMFPVLRALFLAVLLYVTSMPIRCQRSV